MTGTAAIENRIAQARARKAIRLAIAAEQAGVTAEQVATDSEVRDALVAATGVREPSLDTWKLVVSSLQARGL